MDYPVLHKEEILVLNTNFVKRSQLDHKSIRDQRLSTQCWRQPDYLDILNKRGNNTIFSNVGKPSF